MRMPVKGVCALAALGLAILAMPRNASAIPAFARKYHTACTTCHEGFPRLNGVGEAFRLNGYKFNEDDTYIKDEPVKLGAEAYKKVFPDAVWPGEIPGMPPIAFQVKQDLEMPVGENAAIAPRGVKTNFDYPTEVDLLYFASLGDHMSANVGIDFTALDPDGSAHVTPHGWIRFESVVGPDHLFNLKFGSMNGRDLGLYSANEEDSMFNISTNAYFIDSFALPAAVALPTAPPPGPAGNSTGNTFSTGGMNPGVELTGFGRWWLYELGVINTSGSPLDNLSSKDFFSKLAFKIGGVGFDGSGGPSGTLGGQASGFWRDDSLIISVIGDVGDSRVTDPTMLKASDYTTNHFWRAGIGAIWRYCDLELNAAAVWGEDDDPYGNLDHATVDQFAWHVEAQYFIYPWLVPNLRFEQLNVGLPDSLTDGTDAAGFIVQSQDRSRIVAGVSATVRANVRIILEGRASVGHDARFGPNFGPGGVPGVGGEKADDDMVALRFDFAF